MKQANELTKYVLTYLKLNGYKAWRQNNLATRGRQNNVTLGVPDVLAINKANGQFFGAEIKIDKDKLSKDQIEFHSECNEHRPLVFVIKEEKDIELAVKIHKSNK
jgi:hypothetical protein